MKRRSFLSGAAAGGISLVAGGCSILGTRRKVIRPKLHEFNPDMLTVTVPKPPAGTMPMGEVGKTGIRVSKFTFGSHIPPGLIPLEKERRQMIRAAFEYGVNTIDVYDNQYEAMPGHIEPFKNKVVLSTMGGRTEKRGAEEELEYILRLFRRDHIDLVRMHSHTPDRPNWPDWEVLFRLKEKGYIRAVGMPIHFKPELDTVLDTYPIDFVVFPYNFYHNIVYTGKFPGDYEPVARKLRDKGVGVITMKPFASEWFISHLIRAANEMEPESGASLPRAMLRYIINSGLKPDTTMAGMWTLNDVYDGMTAYFNPVMTVDEKRLLDKLRKYAKLTEDACLPDHYRFLDQWAPRQHAV
ncbi:aldo/keto reductase [bacterium]|nr:aldo/keto reductase [bacterium]